jgi:TIR domain/Restriction endonuclease
LKGLVIMDNRMHEAAVRVFLSYAATDQAVVAQIADGLRKGGINVEADAWKLASGDSIEDRVDLAMRTSDLLLVFLSKSSVASRWVKRELSAALVKEMNDRAITIIPVLIEECDIPDTLVDRPYVDLRGDISAGIQRLATQVAAASAVDLSHLDPTTFEDLVTDLLATQGFGVRKGGDDGRDLGYDFLATRTTRDPSGTERTETWVAEVKAYRQQRVGLATIQQLIGVLASMPSSTKGLLITNGRLTSVAREFLTNATREARREVRVIDGAELTGLLIRQPDLAGRYFPAGERGYVA